MSGHPSGGLLFERWRDGRPATPARKDPQGTQPSLEESADRRKIPPPPAQLTSQETNGLFRSKPLKRAALRPRDPPLQV